MKFSIAYAAKWGHALHVELTFAAADGYQDTMDLPMTTSSCPASKATLPSCSDIP